MQKDVVIYKQAAIDALLEEVRLVDGYYVENDEVIDKDDAIEAIRLLPSVTPKRKTGKWILLEECANAGYYCSECRKRVVKEGWSGTVKKIKFCPNCGADMRKESR